MRKVERLREVPAQLERNRERNRAWCATNRNVSERNAWLLGSPAFGTHLPGGGFELHVSPPPKWAVELRNTRGLHGMVTALMGIPHHPTIPQFTLTPWPNDFGWGIYSQHGDVMGRLAGREHEAVLFDRRVVVRCGPLVRVRTPVVAKRGRRRLRIDAITPVLVRENESAMHTHPTAENMHSTLDAWLPRRLGLESFKDDLKLELIERSTEPATVATGGKFGSARGWTGSVIVETNAIGHWLLEVGARIGVGGRVALGMGRIRVSEVRQ